MPAPDMGLRGMTATADVLHQDKALSGCFIVNTHSHYDLILEEEDALMLGLTCSNHGHHCVYIDGDRVPVVEYLPVTLTVKLSNGDLATAHVSPVSFARREVEKKREDVVSVQLRVIGGGALQRLGLRQDHSAHVLVPLSKRA